MKTTDTYVSSDKPFAHGDDMYTLLCAQQGTATEEQLLSNTKEPLQEYKTVLEGVKPELEMKPREPQKQMMQLVEVQPSYTGLLKEVLSQIIITYTYIYTNIYTFYRMYM